MERTYRDIQNKSTLELIRALVDLRVDHYMADPVLLREILTEIVEKEVAQERVEVIDELYNEGYWA